MATREGSRASAEFMARNLVPDVCKSPTIPVPYEIVSFFNCAVNFSTNVRFRKQWGFRHNSRLATVIGNETGVGGGLLSGVNKGFCRPIDGTSSSTVRVNGSFVSYHEGTYVFMNCAGPEGPFNTIGKIYFLGNMLPGPVAPSGKIPKSSFCGFPDALANMQNSIGDVESLVKKGKLLYDLAKTDWSDPSAVLGAIGGVAGIAGLQDVADAAKTAKDAYDTGKQLLNTDWSDPKQALAAVAGAANVANMPDVARAAEMASKIRDTVRADWGDPRQAFAAATNIMQTTGMNEMAAQMANNALLDSNIPVNTGGNRPLLFPPPGNSSNATGGASASAPNSIPPSSDGRPRGPVTPEMLNHLRDTNPVAYDRFNSLSDTDKTNAFIEIGKPAKDPRGNDYSEEGRAAIYIPGEGFSSSQAELDSLPNVSQYLPNGFTSLFVAGKDSPSIGNFFGIEQKDGNAYLFGGLVDLGSPGMPGAGTASTWWVPDRILNADMSRYYDYHDRNYYGDEVRLSDLGQIFRIELDSFRAGATLNPLQLPIQALYSAATTTAGVSTATFNSLSDFFSNVFGSGSSPGSGTDAPLLQRLDAGGCISDMGSNVPGTSPLGGCIPDMGPTGSAPSVHGSGAGGPESGSPPQPPVAAAPDGDASGAGTDGILVTIAAGNPSAAADAALAEIRAANAEALAKAQAEEKAAREKAAREKAAREKAAQEKAAQEKTAQDEAAQDEAAQDEAAQDEAARSIIDAPPLKMTAEELEELNRMSNSTAFSVEDRQLAADRLRDLERKYASASPDDRKELRDLLHDYRVASGMSPDEARVITAKDLADRQERVRVLERELEERYRARAQARNAMDRALFDAAGGAPELWPDPNVLTRDPNLDLDTMLRGGRIVAGAQDVSMYVDALNEQRNVLDRLERELEDARKDL